MMIIIRVMRMNRLVELVRVTLGGKPETHLAYREPLGSTEGRTPYPPAPPTNGEPVRQPRVLDTPAPPNYDDY